MPLTSAPTGLKVWGNYVYLDTEERRRFAQKGHEYLIEQVQHTGADGISSDTSTVRLSYNHPVKELVWCFNNDKTSGSAGQLNELWAFVDSPSNVYATANVHNITSAVNSNVAIEPHKSGSPFLVCNALSGTGAVGRDQLVEGASTTAIGVVAGPLSTFKLILNGQDRFKEQNGTYFNQYQPMQYHSGNPIAGVYSYSFGLKPEEHQPTGTCNFSRIDNAQVQVVRKTPVATGAISKMSMFAVNYNVLRVQSGMGGLAFSN